MRYFWNGQPAAGVSAEPTVMKPLADTQPPTDIAVKVPPDDHEEVRVPAYLATIAPSDYAQALLHPESLLHMDIPRKRTIHDDAARDDKGGAQ